MSVTKRGGRVFTDFSSWTSAHGVPHIGAASSKWMRVFWTVILLVSLSMFCMQFVQLIIKYLDYDVTVQTELKFEEREFPAVTVCNINPYLHSKKPDNTDIQNAVQEYVTFKETNTDDTKDAESQGKAKEQIIYAAGQLPKDQQAALSYVRTDKGAYTTGLIASCTFDQVACAESDFKAIVDPIYGQCFTFNHNATHKSSRAGPNYGLRLLAVSNQDEYLEVTDSVGVRVVVHGHNQHPFSDSFGFNAAAGFTTSFGIKFVEMNRLPAPHGNCTNELPPEYPYGSEYSVEGCFRTCFQKAVIDKVGCSSPKFEKPEGSDAQNCDYSKADQVDMVLNGTEGDLLSQCDCPQPCNEWSYSVTVSTAVWPSSKFKPPECRSGALGYPWTIDENGNKKFTDELCTSWFRENTMTVEVFYERMNYQSLRESAAYSLVNLVSDLGGQLGLWLGVSVITIIEFISLLMMCCAVVCGRKKVHGVDEDAQADSPFNGKRE